jgi:hypothetical protein
MLLYTHHIDIDHQPVVNQSGSVGLEAESHCQAIGAYSSGLVVEGQELVVLQRNRHNSSLLHRHCSV